MPRRDGTGPVGQGSGGGRGRQSRLGAGGGRAGGNGFQAGFCECPNCGTRVPHQPGKPCIDEKCPQCGSKMVRS